MKKLLIVICLFLCLLKVEVKASSSVEYEPSNPAISFDSSTNTLTLNNYIYDGSFTYSDGGYDFAIYADGDLTINLIGTSEVTNNDGIYIDGDIRFTGDGNLTLNYLESWGNEFVIDGGSIEFIDGTYSYSGPQISYPAYIYYDADRKFPYYDSVSGSYYNSFNENPIDSFIVEAKAPLANLDNIYDDVDKIYHYNPYTLTDEELENVDGFIIYEPNKGTTVSYNPATKIYTVEFFDDFSSDDYKIHYFELAFDYSEWGKLVEYEILEATNVYEYKEDLTFSPYTVGQIYYEPKDYVGSSTRYALTAGGKNEVGTGYFTFACKKDNYISVKAKGVDGTYQIINLKVKDNSSPTIEPSSTPSYVIPNTGI